MIVYTLVLDRNTCSETYVGKLLHYIDVLITNCWDKND